MARQKGLEPLAYCLEGSCSIQLSYWRTWGTAFGPHRGPTCFLDRDLFLAATQTFSPPLAPIRNANRVQHHTAMEQVMGIDQRFCETLLARTPTRLRVGPVSPLWPKNVPPGHFLTARPSRVRFPPSSYHENGAGDGNRTHTTSLEGWGSTTELHLRILRRGLLYHGSPLASRVFPGFFSESKSAPPCSQGKALSLSVFWPYIVSKTSSPSFAVTATPAMAPSPRSTRMLAMRSSTIRRMLLRKSLAPLLPWMDFSASRAQAAWS